MPTVDVAIKINLTINIQFNSVYFINNNLKVECGVQKIETVVCVLKT